MVQESSNNKQQRKTFAEAISFSSKKLMQMYIYVYEKSMTINSSQQIFYCGTKKFRAVDLVILNN